MTWVMQPAARLRESALPVAHLPSELSPFLLDPSSTLTITPRPPPPKSRGSETAPPGPAASPLTGLPVLRGADAAGAGFLEDAAWPCALPAGCEGRCRGTNGNQISLLLKPPKVAHDRVGLPSVFRVTGLRFGRGDHLLRELCESTGREGDTPRGRRGWGGPGWLRGLHRDGFSLEDSVAGHALGRKAEMAQLTAA